MTNEPERVSPEPSEDELVCLVEALLFAQGGRVSMRALEETTMQSRDALRAALRKLAKRREGSGVQLRQVGPEWQLYTAERFAAHIVRLRGTRPKPLSRAAMEVLSVIAYRQPVVRADVDAIRGVSSGRVLKGLVDRGLVRVAGRRREPGRPLEYRTSTQFLAVFGLKDLGELPDIRDQEDLLGVDTPLVKG